MMRTTSKMLAAITSATFAVTLGLTGCGGATSAASSSAATSAEATSAEATSAATSATTSAATASSESSVAKYQLEKVWAGMNDDGSLLRYYFEGAGKATGAFLVTNSKDYTYERWLGAMETPAENQVRITDAESGEAIAFTIASTESDGTITINMEDGTEVRMSPIAISETSDVLDTVSTYFSKPGEPAKHQPTAAELGGEYLIKIELGGTAMGQVEYERASEESLGWADSAYTHANAGDKLTIKAKGDNGGTFVKWTRNGQDFSTDAEVEVTIEGDTDFVAVFE